MKYFDASLEKDSLQHRNDSKMSSYQSTKTANKSSSRISKDGNNKQSKQNEKIYHYAGKVHVRGLLRRVWRPRYLALGDDGYLRYHESIPPIFQQQTQYTQNMYNMVHHTHRPKSVLAILDGARVINPYSVVDQHVALPQGVYGFVFRGRPVELSVSSGNAGSKTSRDAVIVPTQNRGDAEKHKPAKAVVNAIFPKGTSRRKTAQKIAKAVSAGTSICMSCIHVSSNLCVYTLKRFLEHRQ